MDDMPLPTKTMLIASTLILTLVVAASGATASDDQARHRLNVISSYHSSLSIGGFQHEPDAGSPAERDWRPTLESRMWLFVADEADYQVYRDYAVDFVEPEDEEPGYIERGKGGNVNIPLDNEGKTYFYIEGPPMSEHYVVASVRAEWVDKQVCDGVVSTLGSEEPHVIVLDSEGETKTEIVTEFGIRCLDMHWLPGPGTAWPILMLLLIAAFRPRKPRSVDHEDAEL